MFGRGLNGWHSNVNGTGVVFGRPSHNHVGMADHPDWQTLVFNPFRGQA